MGHLEDLLAGAAVTLDDEVLDRIDHIVAPGTDIGPLGVSYMPPAIDHAAARRRSAVDLQTCWTAAAVPRPRSSTAAARISTLRTLPLTVMGKVSTMWT
jgi:hypothetical protein